MYNLIFRKSCTEVKLQRCEICQSAHFLFILLQYVNNFIQVLHLQNNLFILLIVHDSYL